MSDDKYPLIVFHGSSAGGKGNYIKRETDDIILPHFADLVAQDFLKEGRFKLHDCVAGPHNDWGGGSGPERLTTSRGGVMSIDLVIPIPAWQGKTQIEFRDFLAENLKECFGMLVERAAKRNVLRNRQELEYVFSGAIEKLIEHEFGDWFWGAARA